jgi:hypothetical protein
MAGLLFTPPNFEKTKKYPAMPVAHPFGGVKEQTAGIYARKMAEKGYVTLAFDASHQGESGGIPAGHREPRRSYIFRPAYIYPVEPRKEPNFSYRLLRGIYPAFRVLFPNQVVPADDLARVMVDAAVHGTPQRDAPVFENRDIRAMIASGATSSGP